LTGGVSDRAAKVGGVAEEALVVLRQLEAQKRASLRPPCQYRRARSATAEHGRARRRSCCAFFEDRARRGEFRRTFAATPAVAGEDEPVKRLRRS